MKTLQLVAVSVLMVGCSANPPKPAAVSDSDYSATLKHITPLVERVGVMQNVNSSPYEVVILRTAEISAPYHWKKSASAPSTTNYCVKATMDGMFGLTMNRFVVVEIAGDEGAPVSKRSVRFIWKRDGSPPYECQTSNLRPFPELLAARQARLAKQSAEKTEKLRQAEAK